MKKFKITLMLCLVVAISAGCAKAVNKDWFASGGSRADAVVTTALTWQANEKPVYSMEQARQLAKKKCQSWGYEDAEAFGGVRQRSNVTSIVWGQPVYQFEAQADFQCIGGEQNKIPPLAGNKQ